MSPRNANRLVIYVAEDQPPALRALLQLKGPPGKERARELLKLGLAAEAAGFYAQKTPAGDLLLASAESPRPIQVLAPAPGTSAAKPIVSAARERVPETPTRSRPGPVALSGTAAPDVGEELEISEEADALLGDVLDSLR